MQIWLVTLCTSMPTWSMAGPSSCARVSACSLGGAFYATTFEWGVSLLSSDGEVAIAPSTDEVVRRLFRALGIEHILERPEFATYEQRLQRRDAVNALVNEHIRARAVEHWIEHLNGAGVPCGLRPGRRPARGVQ